MHSTMPRHEAWRLQYRSRRYCAHLSQQELNKRIRDILIAMLTLTPEAKVGLPPIDPHGIRWMERWTHVLEEMALRFGPYPNGFTKDILHSEPFPNFVGVLASRAASALKHLPSAGVAIKFGRPEHMRALYERGALRIQAASFYRRPDHNGAVRDDELALDVSLALHRDDIVKVVVNPEDVPSGDLLQRFDVRYESATDYWLYCVTASVQPRTFVDFEAEACVVIKDPRRFLEAMQVALAPHVAGAKFRHGRINYVDPLLPQTAAVDIPMSKHFRYSYQDEYRFVWIPPEPRSELTHIDVELGGLQEYSELITLPLAAGEG